MAQCQAHRKSSVVVGVRGQEERGRQAGGLRKGKGRERGEGREGEERIICLI